jgi:glycosyltransferase involved in cell wall biosynthesis
MKIVSVMTTDSRGGAEFAAVEMLDALMARGHEAVMLSDQPAIARDTGVVVRPLEIGPKLSTRSLGRLAAGWAPYLLRLRRALEAEMPYDVLLVHYKKEQLMARMLPRRLRQKLVWAEWGPVPFPMRKGLPRRMYVGASRAADVIMAVSNGTRASVTEVGVDPDRVVYVPNVVRCDDITFTAEGRSRVRADLGIPEEAFVVGCISRFHPKKRNDVVVDATIALGGAAHLILAGDGETEADLRERARPLGDRVHFVPTPGGDVAAVLSAFDVSVFCPSPTEGTPRAVILAMLVERPPLATGAEGVADLIGEGVGHITSPENDPAALAAAITPYRDDPERRRSEGAGARRRAVERFDAPTVARQIEGLLDGAPAGAADASSIIRGR